MQRIITPEEKERKDKRNKIIIGILLVVIMALSTAGYAFFNTEKADTSGKVSYNGHDFYITGNFWTTEISGHKFYFTYLPNETASIKTTKTLNNYQGKPLYLTENNLAGEEIARNLGQFAERVNLACVSGENCTGDLPEKNCSSNLIVIKERNFANVAENDNCVYIFSNDSVRQTDAFLYKILGIK